MESISKIYFIDNPYPNGHNIEEFSWSGRIDEYGSIYFDFHLKTENYYANDDENEEDEAEGLSDWDSKIVWGNYQHTSSMLSSKAFIPKNWPVEKAAEIFKAQLADFEEYEFVELNPKSNKREYKLDKLKH